MNRLKDNFLRFCSWFRVGPLEDLATICIKLFPWIWVAYKKVQHAQSLSEWLRANSLSKKVVIDLAKLPSKEMILRDICMILSNLANSSRSTIDISFLLSFQQSYLTCDLQAITKLLPQNLYGDVEFFFEGSDLEKYHRNLTLAEVPIAEHNFTSIDFGNANYFKTARIKLVPPAHYQNGVRNFLKSLGADRKVIFCDFQEGGDNFFENVQELKETHVFLVRTNGAAEKGMEYKFSNVVYLSRLAFTTSDYIALSHLCDGYIGKFNFLSIFALQRSIPSIFLDSNNILDSSSPLKIFQENSSWNNKSKNIFI